MILKINFPFLRILFQASIPLLLYSFICSIETTLPQIPPLWSDLDDSFIQPMKDVLLRFYSSYPLFMIAMLLFNGLINVIRRPGEAPQTSKNQGIVPQFLRNCLFYTLIYACFQLLPFSVISSLAQKKSYDDVYLINSGLKGFPRILEEGEEAYLMEETSFFKEEPSIEYFEVGKIIGSLPIEAAVAMVISKDGKTVFHMGGPLRILDISDNQNPKTLSTLTLKGSGSKRRALLLSADEKYLYSSAGCFFEIIDISNLRSPTLLSSIIDTDFQKLLNDRWYSLLSATVVLRNSMVLSWDKKTLYIGSDVFQIFSIEDPKQPQLILSTAKYIPNKSISLKSVATSDDGRMLYVANGTIEVYNISMNSNEPVLETKFKGASSVNSILLGRDKRTLYAAGQSQNNTVMIEKLLIEKNFAELRSLEAFDLGMTSVQWPLILETSFSGNTIFLFNFLRTPYQNKQIFTAYNMRAREILDPPSNLLSSQTLALSLIPQTNNFVICNDEEWNIVNFFFNYPNSHAFSLSNNTKEDLKDVDDHEVTKFAVPSSVGTNRLYTLNTRNDFAIVDVTNQSDSRTVASCPFNEIVRSLQISERGKRAFVVDENNKIHVLDFSNFSSITKLGVFDLESSESKFIASSDGKTVFTYTTVKKVKETKLKMLDFSDPSSITILAEEKIEKNFENSVMQASSQGIVYLCLKTEALIYSFSAPESSRLIASVPFPSTEQSLVQCTLFEEKGIFFLETQNQDTFHYLSTFNISDIKSPKLLSTFPLPRFGNYEDLLPTAFSSDTSKAYFWDSGQMIAIDLSDLQSPMIIGQVSFYLYTGSLPRFYLSGDNKFGYFDYSGNIEMINLQMEYSLFLENTNFALGKKYAADFMFLHLNKKSRFEPFAESNYKILKLSLSKISLKAGRYEAQTTLTPLPDWITYNKGNSLLNIESKKERDLGNYTLYSACSLKVPFEAFEFIGNRSQVGDLVATLVSLGFLDNQRFLTASFGAEEDFMIQSHYSEKKEEIYKTLKKFYFETFTPFNLQPSLDLRVDSGFLSIRTPSLDVIKVDIKLKENDHSRDKNSQPQFLSRAYGSLIPSITEHKTHFRIEGRLVEVNMALEKLVVNNKMLTCDGEVLVTDYLNQPLVKDIKDIVKYFTSNKPPRMNVDVQGQIDMAPVHTGEFVTIFLNHSTFIDDNVENLNYKLVMNTPERHEKPSWLVFSNDLVMKITAPEQLFNREIKLLLIAENEFEKVEIPFTLEIKLSPVYFLKLLIRFSPYILTIIGLYIKANKIYNIVFRKWYKHPKEFVLEIGKEIEIPPVWFIAEENKESRVILKEICQKVTRDLGCSASDREKLVDYFWNFGGELKTDKLRQSIDEAVDEIEDNKKKLKLYLSEGKSRKTLINQMIENQFVLWKLDLKQEKTTKNMYNKMKNDWVKLVKWDKLNNQFIVKQEKFDEILETLGGKISSKESTGESVDLTQTSSEPLLSKESEINVDLLKRALRIFAFQNYSLNKDSTVTYIKVRQRKKANCFKRLLRADLIEVSFSENRNIVYEIMYKIESGRLEFTGTPHQDLEGETLAIQITNHHERILKEFWIHGVPRGAREKSFMIQTGHEVL